MNETETTEKPELATQNEYEFEKDGVSYLLPGLAEGADGRITIASFLDLLMVCLAVSDNDNVARMLKANKIVLRDKKGQILFPKTQS